jgi:hypothetical protein
LSRTTQQPQEPTEDTTRYHTTVEDENDELSEEDESAETLNHEPILESEEQTNHENNNGNGENTETTTNGGGTGDGEQNEGQEEDERESKK